MQGLYSIGPNGGAGFSLQPRTSASAPAQSPPFRGYSAPLFGTRRALIPVVQNRAPQNQQFTGDSRNKIPTSPEKILPGGARLISLLDRIRIFQVPVLTVPAIQVPVVAPAGFRSPGVAVPGAAVQRRGSGVMATPEGGVERYRSALPFKVWESGMSWTALLNRTRGQLSFVLNTCETGSGTGKTGSSTGNNGSSTGKFSSGGTVPARIGKLLRGAAGSE
jgi:hypothetical protein